MRSQSQPPPSVQSQRPTFSARRKRQGQGQMRSGATGAGGGELNQSVDEQTGAIMAQVGQVQSMLKLPTTPATPAVVVQFDACT